MRSMFGVVALLALVACRREGASARAPIDGASADSQRTSIRCVRNEDCSDRVFCNGVERCAPEDPGADARGCVAADLSFACTERDECDETARRCVPLGRPACLTYHAEGWLMDCTEYRFGGAFLRTGRSVAERACSIGQGTFTTQGCPAVRSLGTCELPETIGYYYPDPHEQVTRAALQRTCETPLRDGSHGVFHPPR